MAPSTDQSGREITQLSQFNLQFPFMSSGSLSKNIQNQAGSIEDPALQGSLQISLLKRGYRMVDDHQTGL
jgi:hypothetical protein